MVHALREARRVLRPGGILIDLRPAAVHRRVGIGEGRRWRLIGVMRETFEDDRAADRAVATALREGWLRRGRRVAFRIDRVMDGMTDLRGWLKEFGQRRRLGVHEWLIRRVERSLDGQKAKIVGRGPIQLRVLRRGEDPKEKRRRRTS